ncbi:hypothetical protein GHK58_10460 [Sinorhizobium meliloti]|nr:hypothetical protein [Sinorhizobium meliloti]
MRPQPPISLFENISSLAFIPGEDLPEWIKATFLNPSSPLHNEEHAHLVHAEIGFLWTVVENSRKGRRIIGQCEEGKPQGAMGKWARTLAEMQAVVRLRPGFHPHARCRILPGMWGCRIHGASSSTSSTTLPKRRMHSVLRSSTGRQDAASSLSADMSWKSSSALFAVMAQMQLVSAGS